MLDAADEAGGAAWETTIRPARRVRLAGEPPPDAEVEIEEGTAPTPRERQRVLVDRALAVARHASVGELVRRRRPQPQLRRRPQEADLRREGRARRREEGQRRDGPRQRSKTGEPGRHEDRAGHVQVDAPRAAVRDVVDDFCSAVASSAAELERYRRARR